MNTIDEIFKYNTALLDEPEVIELIAYTDRLKNKLEKTLPLDSVVGKNDQTQEFKSCKNCPYPRACEGFGCDLDLIKTPN